MNSVLNDLRLTRRLLRRTPGSAAVIALTLAMGIGANTCVFSVVYTVLIRDLPFREPGRLVALWSVVPDGLARMIESKRNLSSVPDLQDWAAGNRVFEALSAHDSGSLVSVQSDGDPARLQSMRAHEGFFSVLGVAPALGRTFLQDEHEVGATPVVVLSDRCWRVRFGARPDILGRALAVDGASHIVVGVLPPGFTFASEFAPYRISSEPELWRPLIPTPGLRNRGNHTVFPIARLKPGATLAQAQADMQTIVAGLARQYPQFHEGWGIEVVPLHESMRGSRRTLLLLLLAAVALVLTISCVNVANLLLIRASERDREMAIRRALGAGSARVARQLLTESLVLALLGGCLGLGLAWLGCRLVEPFLGGLVRGLPPLELSLPVLGATLAVSLLAGLLFGLAPVRQLSRIDVNEALKENARALCGGRHRFGSSLVVLEVALSVLLLIGAGLLVNSFVRVWRAGPGFRPEKVLAVNVALSGPSFADPAQQTRRLELIRERLETLPGVEAVAISSALPHAVTSQQVFRILGGASPELRGGSDPASPSPNADYQVVSPEYFRALGIPLLAGRLFTPQDASAPHQVALINETMARRFWPGRDPLGAVLEIGARHPIVIGVVGDTRERGLVNAPRAHVYSAYPQLGKGAWEGSHLLVRTAVAPAPLASAIRREIRVQAPGQPVEIRTLESLLSESVATPRLVMGLFTTFAVVALLLALLGTYSVIAFAVSQRTREIGIRMALGAREADVLRMVLAHGTKLVLPGLVLGVVSAMAATRLLSSQLHGVTPTDPLTYAAVSSLMLGVSLAACYLPARAALRVDPLASVRCQ